jgi:hypothetical protein
MDARPTVVSGSPATLADLGMDERRLREWLAEDPTRLGLGRLTRLPGEPSAEAGDDAALLLTDGSRCLVVVVQTGEVDAEHGFHVLDLWARQRTSHADRIHTAVLVAEAIGRHETVLSALAERLPLVVVQLRCWRGHAEALVVPSVVLSGRMTDVPSAEPRPTAGDVEPADGRPGRQADLPAASAPGDGHHATTVDPGVGAAATDGNENPATSEAPPAETASPVEHAPPDREPVAVGATTDPASGTPAPAGHEAAPARGVPASASGAPAPGGSSARTTPAAANNDPWRLSRRFAETMAAINAEKGPEAVPSGR